MEKESSSQDKDMEANESLRLAQERVRAFYELLDRQAEATHGPNLIRRAINEAMRRARPEEIVELPDEQQ